FGLAENTYDLFVGKTLLHGDVLMWLMKTLLTSRCINQRGAGHRENLTGIDMNIAQQRPGERERTFAIIAHHQSKGPLFDRAFGVCWF
ncbi:hypothetical protein, partial [Klebsiella pneumoniae]|uniref:hypothetical protein n=1 Tax=Klebsiella pneumoniae TaxID=573 RepID=UPI0020CD4312